MSDRANSFKLGLFTLIAVLLFLGFLTALGAGLFSSRGLLAETYTPDSVQGLDVRAPVRFRGVRVGEVTFIGFVGQKYDVSLRKGESKAGWVIIQMNLDPRTGLTSSEAEATLDQALKEGLHARLASSSLMGPAYLELFIPRTEERPAPLDLSWVPEGAVIPSSPSVMSQITSSIESLASHLSEIDFKQTFGYLDRVLSSADRAFGSGGFDQMRQSFVDTMVSANDAATRLRDVLKNPSIDRILANADEVAASLNSGSAERKDLADFVRQLPQIASNLRVASGRLDEILNDEKTRRTLENLDRTLASTPAAAGEIRDLARRLNALVAESQADVERSLSLLRQTLENLDALSADAKSNPSRLIFGEPPPRTRPGREPVSAPGTGDKK